MTKKKWINHMEEVTKSIHPSRGGNRVEWAKVGHEHLKNTPDCPECQARRKSRAKNREARIMSGVYKDLGMKKVKGSLGGTYWEDIYKYGTKEEVEFLLEAIMPANFVKSMMNFKNYLDAPQGKDAKIQYQNLKGQVNEIQKKGSMEIVKFLRDNQKPVNDFIIFVDLLLKGKRPPEPNLINIP